MKTERQLPLPIGNTPPGEPRDLVSWIDGRLPKTFLVSLVDVAVAFDRHPKVVEMWREAGAFAGAEINKNLHGQRAKWAFYRWKVIEFTRLFQQHGSAKFLNVDLVRNKKPNGEEQT